MSRVADVVAILEGKELLTVVERYGTEEEKEYTVNIKRDCPDDPDDCTSNVYVSLFDEHKKGRFNVPLDCDLIHGIEDFLQILSAFTGTGRPQVFRLYSIVKPKRMLEEEFRVTYTKDGPSVEVIPHRYV